MSNKKISGVCVSVFYCGVSSTAQSAVMLVVMLTI